MSYTYFLASFSFIVVCLSRSFVSADEEYFTIKRNDLVANRDRFVVPSGERVPRDFCSKFQAERYSKSKSDCRCPLVNSTFGYYENAWVCFANAKLKQQQACRGQFVSSPTVLYTVASFKRKYREYKVNFTNAGQSCHVSSWMYQKCGGQWIFYNTNNSSPRLSLRYSSSDEVFKLKVSLPKADTKFLDGSLIKVAMKCLPGSRNQDDCLLFKLRGAIKCSTIPPVMPTTTTARPSSAATTPSVQSTAEALSIPDIGTTILPGDKDNTEVDDNDELNVPAVVGAVVGGVLAIAIVVVIALFIIRRRGKKRSNNNSAKAKPNSDVGYKVAHQSEPTAPGDGDYAYQDPSVAIRTEAARTTDGVYMEAFQTPSESRIGTPSSQFGVGSSEAAIYDLPFLGPKPPSSRVPSEYEPLRRVGSGAEDIEYEDMNGRQSVYQELQRPPQEEEPMYVVIR